MTTKESSNSLRLRWLPSATRPSLPTFVVFVRWSQWLAAVRQRRPTNQPFRSEGAFNYLNKWRCQTNEDTLVRQLHSDQSMLWRTTQWRQVDSNQRNDDEEGRGPVRLTMRAIVVSISQWPSTEATYLECRDRLSMLGRGKLAGQSGKR